MSGSRYFIALHVTDDRRARVRELVDRDPELVIQLERSGLIVVTDRAAATIDLNGHGVVIGDLHTPGQRPALTSLKPDTVAVIAASRGDHLVRAYWGDYVAVLGAQGSAIIDVLRSPLSALPCFHIKSSSATLLASDVDFLQRLGEYRAALDWDAISRFAIAPDVREAATCLAGLNDLRGGDRLTIEPRGTTIASLWSPWKFAQGDQQLNDRDEAVRRLHGSIASSFSSQLHASERALVMLSGGLDSSIVAANVSALGIDGACMTTSTAAPNGDERTFARRTADHVRLPLTETWFDLAAINLERSGAARLPRPVARAFEYEARRQANLLAVEGDADVVLSGGGGDNIFCSIQSVSPAVDALDAHDDRREFWRTAREISRMSGASLANVAWRSWRRSWQRKRQYPPPYETLFLDADVRALTSIMPQHPWLQRPATVLQGKGAHVAALLGVETLTGDRDIQDPLALRFPLLSQPIVETCLRIPTWLWYDRGCNRAIARQAFADQLPADIAWRRSKGTPDGFVVEIFDARRDQIREMLLGGNLARQGMLDRAALTLVIDDARPVRGTDHGRVMRLVDIEAWTRAWSN